MEKTNKISAEEMRSLIKNIYELSQKISGNISIKNLDSAAEFAVNLFGFKNWKEYKNSLNKESNLFNLLESEDNLYLPKNIKFNDKKIFELKKYQFKENTKVTLTYKESSNFPNEYLIGSHEIKNMKTKQPRGLMSKDAIITSNKNIIYRSFIEKQINWLLDNEQNFIIFSNKDVEKIYFPENIKKIDQNNITLNPINAILNSDLLDLFFRIEDSPKSFSYLWSFLVKKFNIEGKVLSIDDLINMTNLDKLLEIKENCVNDFVLDKMLKMYLSKYVENNDNVIFISKENQENHYKENSYLINKLKEIKILYENGYFSENGYSLKEAIYKKESCIIAEYNNHIYNELIINEYIQAKNEFIKEKGINENNHLIWVLFLETEMWLQNYQQELLKEHISFAQFFYILNNYSHIDGIFKSIKQILFLKQSLNYKNSIIKDRILNLTENDEVQFWYNNNNILKHLKENEAVLWRTNNDPFAPTDLESFILEKIELY
jgi:hypothetical protein